jgi:hypothetical protein
MEKNSIDPAPFLSAVALFVVATNGLKSFAYLNAGVSILICPFFIVY